MDSYDFSRRTGRPVSPPLPENYSMDYLPQMPTYSGSTQSRNTSVPQPIDFGGSTSRYTGATQSRNTSVPQLIDFGGSTSRYTGATQSRHTSVPPIEYGSASQGTSTQSHRAYPPEYRYAAVSSWQNSGGTSQRAYAEGIGVPRSTFRDWVEEAGGPTQRRPSQRRTPYTPEERSTLLSQWQARGERETQSEFSSRTGVPVRTLQNWIRQENDSSRGAH